MKAEKVTLASQVRINEGVVYRDLDGEIVLLNLTSGVYFGLDPTGTKIWHLLTESRPLRKILDALVEEHEVAEGQCQRDLLYFLEQLREKHLIEVSD